MVRRRAKRRSQGFGAMSQEQLYEEALKSADTALDMADEQTRGTWGGRYGTCDSALINLVRASDWLGRAEVHRTGLRTQAAMMPRRERLHNILTRFHCGCGRDLVGKDKW